MQSIILLTGVIGAGKSTVAKNFSPPAFVVHADILQHDAVLRAFPFVRREFEFRWEVWPENKSMMHMNRLFGLSLRSTHEGIFQHRGDVIVEGCVICKDWFADPLVREIRAVCQFGGDVPVHRLNLIPPAEQVLDQILKRDRKNELKEFGNIEGVKRHIGYAEDRTEHGWQRFSNHESIEAAIKAILTTN